MNILFCRRCGAPTTQQTENEFLCKNGHRLFAYNAPAIGLFLVNDKKEVLLVTRGRDPGKGKFDVPGGFVDLHENLEQTVAREIAEELHISPKEYSTPQFLRSGLNDYQFAGELMHPLDVFFWAYTKGELTLRPDDDVADAHWHLLASVRTDDLAFKTVRQALEQLKKHLS
jgi:NAD+ diphosphatase